MSFVVDVSVALPWNVTSQANALIRHAAETVVRDGAVVPFHFPLEYCNALAMLLRQRRITRGQFDTALVNIRDLDLAIDATPVGDVDVSILPLALRHGLSLYDAAYLELALRTGLPLATRDEALATAAREAGAGLLDPT